MTEMIQIDITHVVLLLFRNNRLIDVINYILYYFSIEEKQVFFSILFLLMLSQLFFRHKLPPQSKFLFCFTKPDAQVVVLWRERERERYWLLFVISSIYPQWVENRRKNAWEIIIVICSYNCMIIVYLKKIAHFFEIFNSLCDDLVQS